MRTGSNLSFVAAVKMAPPLPGKPFANRLQTRSGGHRHLPSMKSWRRTLRAGARIADFVCVDHEPLASVIRKRQVDCNSGAGHLPAIIKPKIVRHTIILSANYLFLLTPPTSLSGRLANPAVINLSIRSSLSLPSTFRVIFFFGVEPFNAFS
jgi:hypothetical protein